MSAPLRILVIGSGERVRKAALPVFERAPGFELAGVVSRTPKTIESDGRSYNVLGLETLTPERLTEIDLIYMVVKKPAVPAVLRTLAATDLSRLDLLIETPVMLVRHLGHRKLLELFRNVWVSEDCQTLPCFDAVQSLVEAGAIGELRSARFDRSGYAYHGMAMVKATLGPGSIRRARQVRFAGGLRERTVHLTNGRHATIIDPRDYSLGTMIFEGTKGSIADGEMTSHHRLEALLDQDRCIGFRAGACRRELTAPELELIGSPAAGPGVTAWMDGMKRVGFLALMARIRAGQGAYPLSSAIEDSVVDYYLEKIGRYLATPFTRPDAALPRLAFSLLTKACDR